MNEFDLLETGLQRICQTESKHTPVVVILTNIDNLRLPEDQEGWKDLGFMKHSQQTSTWTQIPIYELDGIPNLG